MSPNRYRAEKAYKNLDFINSPDARPLRILAEYLEPATRFRGTLTSSRLRARQGADEYREHGDDHAKNRTHLAA